MGHIRSSVSSPLPSLLLPLPSSGIIQHGDLEFFLSELRLGQYIHPLREQGTTFADLLSVTDEGLVKVCGCVYVTFKHLPHFSPLFPFPHSLPVFSISLPLPLLTPAQLGITDEGARRAILEGVTAIHKKKWHMPSDPIPVDVSLK